MAVNDTSFRSTGTERSDKIAGDIETQWTMRSELIYSGRKRGSP